MEIKTPTTKKLEIKAPEFRIVELLIRGTAPLVMHKFGAKVKAQMIKTQEGGSQSQSKKKREPKDFDAVYRDAFHTARKDKKINDPGGWHGIPCGAFRNAAISACRTVGYKMTHAKLAFFIMADGYEADDGTPLVKIQTGEPEKHTAYARNDNGSVDIRIRPMWKEWTATLRIRYDEDMFSDQDVANLVMRVGMQVGLLEGRPDSKNSAGQGWGTFEIVQGEEAVHGKKAA
jgi:hypothetical protein